MKSLNIENEYCFDDSIHIAKKSSINAELKNFIWNWKTKEFLGRDSASWGNFKRILFQYMCYFKFKLYSRQAKSVLFSILFMAWHFFCSHVRRFHASNA